MGREKVIVICLMLFGAIVFMIGAKWGLPSRAPDAFLFGDRTPWDGKTIRELAPADISAAADLDVNPLDRSTPVVLNETGRQRAEIIQRYRLFSYQPDEMITFRALSRAAKTRGDPQLYQYGGLWIYPVGALVKVFCRPRNDRAYYFDHPEEFGKFYVVARLYCAAWGVAGVWAVFAIARKFGGNLLTCSAAAACFVCMPITINMAHEAKPHLPAAVLMLFAVLAAMRYLQSPTSRWAVITGALCGAAFGMVLSALPIFVILPVMVWLRRMSRAWVHLVVAAVVGIGVYLATNPFVLVHLLGDRTPLRANLENSRAMYAVGIGGISNAIWLIGEGASWAVLVVAVIASLAWSAKSVILRYSEGSCLESRRCFGVPQHDMKWLLPAPLVLVTIQFIALAANKPPEYARFALFIDIALAIFACMAAKRAAIGLVLVTAFFGVPYEIGFLRDCGAETSRIKVARVIQNLPGMELKVSAEPAPYCMPPVDLFRWKIVLPPKGQEGSAMLKAIDWPSLTPISWANKDFKFTSSSKNSTDR